VKLLDAAVAPIAVTVRSGFEESLHHGVAVALDADGRVISRVGDPDAVVYPRSSLKPLQTTAMIALGFDAPPDSIALACASHDGSPVHVEGVRRMLESFGLDESDLRNTATRPYDPVARAEARALGIAPSPIQQNCSGKHAAMLATCRINGWSIDDYLDVEHPLQRGITAAIGEMASHVWHVGVDGCGAPTHALALRDLASAMAAVTRSRCPAPRAMSAHPDLVGGPTRDVSVAMRAVPGLAMKDGAQGVTVAAMPDGRAVALKVADGSDAARRAVTASALAQIGVELPDGVRAALVVPVLGHGARVGEVRPIEWTSCDS
jgi:L-asparaginase II